ncbi:zinc-ribbon domain-containing protein [Curtobacterium sp. NPDC089689]|uniref:zinc-ribbon domain-containing protein n=1 Tax=Curtobacterium sp. NPDC089689 TaxID=3363968 RepID=UPI003805CC86
MIRCEHCGSALPDGAIFCGECGRAVTASASRLPAATAPVEQAPPPPLLQPDVHGRRPDPAADAWLPEATLDPATRAWLTGSDRPDEQAPAPTPVHRPDDPAQRSVSTDPDAAGSGPAPWTPTAGGASIDEPPLDPDAFASRPTTGTTDDDPEVTRVAERARRGAVADGTAPQAPTAPPTAPVWESPVQQDAPSWQPPAAREAAPAQPSTPSWWIGRSNSAAQSTPTESSTDVAHAPGVGTDDASEHSDAAADGRRATPSDEGSGAEQGEPEGPAPVASPPQPGDTAVVEPLVDRRPAPQRPATQRPTPLVTPGSAGATCHVCGHTLEPDDIFCGECGAVRPAVTAAFTGPIVPLPVARPDWAADGDEPADAGDTVAEHDEVATGTDTSTGTADGPADVVDDPAAAAEPSLGGSPADDDDQLFRAAVRPRGLHAAPTPDGDTPDVSATAGPVATDGQTPTSAPLPPVPTAAPLPPVPGLPEPTPTQLPTTPLGRPVVPSSAGAELDDGDAPDDGPPDGTAPDDSAHDATAPDEEPDVDETRIVSKTPTHAPFVLHFSTGERFGVHGTGLLGRLPRPQPGERFDDLLTVHDPGKSVSKTHLELGRDGGDLWVSDRFSGNGTVVRHIDGSIRRCEPGRRYRVERGARVDIGEQFFLVQ